MIKGFSIKLVFYIIYKTYGRTEYCIIKFSIFTQTAKGCHHQYFSSKITGNKIYCIPSNSNDIPPESPLTLHFHCHIKADFMKTLLSTVYLALILWGSSSIAQVTLLSENFNGAGTPAGWIKINNSTGGTVLAADWTLRADGYTYSSTFVNPPETFHSNDNSQFYLSNSDAQGGDVTETIIQSPAFSTTGYGFVTISFYHYFWEYLYDRGYVEASTDGSSWQIVKVFTYPNDEREGASDQFVLKTIDLSAVAANSGTVYIRFRYYAEFGYYWALDNVTVTGYTTNPCPTNSWEGGVSTAWENPANWSCGLVPDATTIVSINAGKARYPVINSVAACKSINIFPGASVDVSAGFTLQITNQ
jgi:hypothetical protein